MIKVFALIHTSEVIPCCSHLLFPSHFLVSCGFYARNILSCVGICSYLQKELCPVSQVVGENRRVEGFYAFFVQPALAAGAVLVQLPEVWSSGHLSRDTGGDGGQDQTTLM